MGTLLPHWGQFSLAICASFQAAVSMLVPEGNSRPYLAAVSKEERAGLV